jgi:hypothetical protein
VENTKLAKNSLFLHRCKDLFFLILSLSPQISAKHPIGTKQQYLSQVKSDIIQEKINGACDKGSNVLVLFLRHFLRYERIPRNGQLLLQILV